jgi:hypothetical protein
MEPAAVETQPRLAPCRKVIHQICIGLIPNQNLVLQSLDIFFEYTTLKDPGLQWEQADGK